MYLVVTLVFLLLILISPRMVLATGEKKNRENACAGLSTYIVKRKSEKLISWVKSSSCTMELCLLISVRCLKTIKFSEPVPDVEIVKGDLKDESRRPKTHSLDNMLCLNKSNPFQFHSIQSSTREKRKVRPYIVLITIDNLSVRKIKIECQLAQVLGGLIGRNIRSTHRLYKLVPILDDPVPLLWRFS